MATFSPSTAEIVRQSGAVPGAEYLLEVSNVRKAFPGVLALDDVSFKLKRGCVHALMGENGAGKSTLMKIIAGIYTPNSGSFKLKGQEITLTSPLDALQYGIAMIHQELNLMSYMTVAENIWIRREPLNMLGFVRHDEMRRRTKELFQRLDIPLDPETEVRDLSVANRQMVEIAKAVSYDFDVLIMDEPTSALTDREVEHLFRIIRALRDQGKGIIYITHKMNELFEIADEVSVFRDGRFVGEHKAVDVTRDDIIKLMVGRELTQMFPKEIVPIGGVALSAQDLCLAGKFHGVSFDLHKGEILGFAGTRRVWAQQRRRDPIRGDACDIRQDRDRRQGDCCQGPGCRDGRRHGVPDRGPKGERLLPTPRHRREHADRASSARLCDGRVR